MNVGNQSNHLGGSRFGNNPFYAHDTCQRVDRITEPGAADYLCGLEVTGREGVTLHDYWAGRPRAFSQCM